MHGGGKAAWAALPVGPQGIPELTQEQHPANTSPAPTKQPGCPCGRAVPRASGHPREAEPAPGDQPGPSVLVPCLVSPSPAPCPPLSLPTCRRRRSFGNPPTTRWFSAGKRQPGGKGQSWRGKGHGATGATVTGPRGRAPAPRKGSPGRAQLGTRWTMCGRRPCHGEKSVMAKHGRDSVEGGLPRPCVPKAVPEPQPDP